MQRIAIPKDFPVSKLLTVDGVTIEGNDLIFDDSFLPTRIEKYISEAKVDWADKSYFKLGKAKSFKPNDMEINALKQSAPNPSMVDGFKFYEISAANTRLDRENDQFTKSFLELLAKSLKTSDTPSVLFNHRENILIGGAFDAYVKPIDNEPDKFELMMKTYVLPDATHQETGQKFVSMIDSGTLKYVSIRFSNGPRPKMVEIDNSFIRIFDAMPNDTLVFPEVSWVWYPAQVGAQRKSFDFPITQQKEKPQMANFSESKSVIVGDKSFNVTVAGEASEYKSVSVTLPVELTDYVKSLEEKAGKVDNYEKQLTDLKTPIVNSIITLQDKLEKSYKRDEATLKAIAIAELTAMESDLQKEFTAKNPTNQLDANGKPVGTEENVKSFQL